MMTGFESEASGNSITAVALGVSGGVIAIGLGVMLWRHARA